MIFFCIPQNPKKFFKKTNKKVCILYIIELNTSNLKCAWPCICNK